MAAETVMIRFIKRYIIPFREIRRKMKCTFTAMKMSTRYVGAKMAERDPTNLQYTFFASIWLKKDVYFVGKRELCKGCFYQRV